MKFFLIKLEPVTFEEELHHKSFLMTFAKFWRALLNSCFKKMIIKRKVNGKGHN